MSSRRPRSIHSEAPHSCCSQDPPRAFEPRAREAQGPKRPPAAKEEQETTFLAGAGWGCLQRIPGDFFLHAKAYRFRVGRASQLLCRACAPVLLVGKGFFARKPIMLLSLLKTRPQAFMGAEDRRLLRVTDLLSILLQVSFVTRLFTVGLADEVRHCKSRQSRDSEYEPLNAAAGLRSLRRVVNEACATFSERERLRQAGTKKPCPALWSFHPPPDGPCFAPQCPQEAVFLSCRWEASRQLQRDFQRPFAQTHSPVRKSPAMTCAP